MTMGRIPLPTSRRSAVVSGVAVLTLAASLGATMTGAVRPVRARGGRFYRPPSGVVWQAGRTQLRNPKEMTMADALAMIEVVGAAPTTSVTADEDGLEPDPSPGVRQALLG